MRPAEDRPVAVQKPLLEKPCRHLWHLHHAAKPCRCRVKGIRGRIKGARMLVKREGRPHKRLLSFIRAGRKGVEVDIVCLLPERRGQPADPWSEARGNQDRSCLKDFLTHVCIPALVCDERTT